jgi:STE24 endopeptidase
MERAVDSSGEKEYNKIKVRISIADIFIDITLLAVLAFSGISVFIAGAASVTGNDYSNFILFIFFIGVIFSVTGFPLSFYSSYILEHRFGLSNQTVAKWFLERAKSSFVGALIGIPVAVTFYFLLKAAGDLWWFYFSLFIFFVSVFLAKIAPVVIFPIFYKFKELDNDELKVRLEEILKNVNIDIKGIFSFNMSKDTKKANAGFTGLGRSKRIILSDTLLENFTEDEIAVVFAHEAGHYRHRHIVKNIILSTIIIFSTFFICGSLYTLTIENMGYEKIYDLAALPVLVFYLTIFGLIMMPLTNYISRKYEFEADRYALEVTGDIDSFVSTMEKLAARNLADREPHPVIEFIFYSHPSIKRRIAAAGEIEK